ncbi:MAG: hypothetical protein H7039_22155, partial [Bryobacteraceae bacterium]|nr:hypothetical protein [Bryobacteraceae bacterium]
MSTYHGLQVNYRRRFQNRLLINAAYTWAKALDNISSDGGQIEHDAFNSRNNRGPADFDRTHRLTAAWVYELPGVLKSNSLARTFVNGWALSGMATIQSGSPFTVLGAATGNAYFAQVARVRPDLAAGRTIESARKDGRVQDRLNSFFDPTAFANSEDRWGNAGRNILRGPRQTQVDFALAKTFRFAERYAAEMRWEAFNAFNQTTFSNPSNSLPLVGYGTTGTITSTIGGPRTMQVALRLRF